MPRRADLTGRTYCRLNVIRFVEIANDGHSVWKCRCKCGKTTKVKAAYLNNGAVRSCGCLQRDCVREIGKGSAKWMATHGLSKHPIYGVWSGMMTRCYNAHASGYCKHGGRGIRVCKRWHDVRNFVKDMGASYPGRSYQIERVANDGNYSPSNCIWATAAQQARNRRSNVKFTHNGRTMCLKDWATELGVDYRKAHKRVRYKGWTISKALGLTQYNG